MVLFPVFLRLAGRRCLVVGGGAVGCDKAAALAEAGAEVLVVDPDPSRQLQQMAAGVPALRIDARPFGPEDLDGCALAFACTGDATVNDRVLAAAAEYGVPACASGPAGDDGDFSCGALLRRGEVCVAVASGGASPGLAAAARDRAAAAIGEEFAQAATLLAALRAGLQRDVADGERRRAAMREVAGERIVELLEQGRRADAEALCDDAGRRARAATNGEVGRCTR